MKTIYTGIVLLLLGLVSAWAFRSGEMTPSEWHTWLRDTDNGLRVEKQIGNYQISAQYQSADLLALQEWKAELTSDLLQERRRNSDNVSHFALQLGLKDPDKPILRHLAPDPQSYQG